VRTRLALGPETRMTATAARPAPLAKANIVSVEVGGNCPRDLGGAPPR
jgi:hypothetical protein